MSTEGGGQWRCSVSKLGSKYLLCAGDPRRSCVNARGWGWEIVHANSFVPGEFLEESLPHYDMLISKPRPHLYAPDVFQTSASVLYLRRLFVVFSLSGQRFSLLMPSWLSQS